MALGAAVLATAGLAEAQDIGRGHSWGDSFHPHTPHGAVEGYRYSSISANWGYTLAIDKDGDLYIWGDPFNWTGGVGTLPSEPPGPYVAVAAGWDHALALHQDGRVVAWGANDWGQQNPIPNYSFKAIAADEKYNMGIIKSEDPDLDDALIVWGGNYNMVDFPADLLAPTFNPANVLKVHAIAAGGHHARRCIARPAIACLGA